MFGEILKLANHVADGLKRLAEKVRARRKRKREEKERYERVNKPIRLDLKPKPPWERGEEEKTDG